MFAKKKLLTKELMHEQRVCTLTNIQKDTQLRKLKKKSSL